jgi:hypothetical protein
MRAREFVTETTVSGAIATVAQPMMSMLAREPAQAPAGKYNTDSRKPASNVNRRFKNSFSK